MKGPGRTNPMGGEAERGFDAVNAASFYGNEGI